MNSGVAQSYFSPRKITLRYAFKCEEKRGKAGQARYFLFFESVVQDSGSCFERQRGMDFVLRRFPGTTTLAGQLCAPLVAPGFTSARHFPDPRSLAHHDGRRREVPPPDQIGTSSGRRYQSRENRPPGQHAARTLPRYGYRRFHVRRRGFFDGPSPRLPTYRTRAETGGQFVIRGRTICRGLARRPLAAWESPNLPSCGDLWGLSGYPQWNPEIWANAPGNYFNWAPNLISHAHLGDLPIRPTA
jgi:hypothetical protein